ncbi:MAG: hypothetical protein SGJ27_26895 [Candidatus Melainabacteria bacterium]|nr:hypothetical protein [Candidatus Melainabacteria bacterium]
MISHRRLALGTAILAIAGALGSIFLATDRGATIDEKGIPPGIASRVEVSKNEEVRTVELYPDSITAKHSFATHKDGSVTNYWYRPDGTLEKAITDGPEAADGKRPRLRYAEVAPDGFTYALDVEYLTDGRKSKETVLSADGKVTRTYFHNNGVERRVQELAHGKTGWKIVQENQFRDDKSLLQSLQTLDNNAWERKFYNDEGVLTNTIAMGPYGSRYFETAYDIDGVTRTSEMEQTSQKTVITTFRKDGSPIEERTWSGAVSGSSIRVVRFDSKINAVMQQWWTFRNNKHSLWMIKVFRSTDHTLWKNIYFDPDNLETTEIVYDGDGEMVPNFTRRKYGKDGLLVEEERVLKSKTVSTKKIAPERNIRISLPADYTVLSDMPVPKQVIPYVPAPMGGP